MRLVSYDAASAVGVAEAVHALYAAEYPPGPDFAEWRDGLWARHRGRPGFELLIAWSGDRIAAVAWAYLGDRGQYWSDAVVASLPGHVAREWVGGHLEIVELIVAPEFRRQGIATELLVTLLDRSTARRALLSVPRAARPARALYRSLGWRELGPLGRDLIVMGTEVRESDPDLTSSPR